MSRRNDIGSVAIAEISGADSVAAALRFCEENPSVRTLLPTYVHTGTEFGDFDGIRRNLAFLGSELETRLGVTLLPLEESSEPALWWALNGRFGSVLAERYGAWVPCVGCHLYLHLMRAPIALRTDAVAVISGEREWHGAGRKPNQGADALDAYMTVLARADVHLDHPIRHVVERAEVEAILGERWIGGSPQLECVLSGNYRGIDGESAVTSLPTSFYQEFLIPAGVALAAALTAGEAGYGGIVSGVLRDAGVTP